MCANCGHCLEPATGSELVISGHPEVRKSSGESLPRHEPDFSTLVNDLEPSNLSMLQRWWRAVRRAKAGLPFSVTASGAACISVPRRATIASASRSRRPAFELRMAGKVVRHEPPAGSLIITPRFDCAADARRQRRYADRRDRSRVARARRCRGLGGVDRTCVELRPLASRACPYTGIRKHRRVPERAALL